MKHTSWYCYLLFASFLVFSCGENSSNSKAEAVVSKGTITSDSNFVKLKSFFDRNSKDSLKDKPQIPFALINSFYKAEDSINQEYHNSITPTDFFENKYGQFFIIEIACGAGGYCSTFDLLVFSREGRFIGREFLGQNAGDLGFSEDFSYKIISDTTLLIGGVTHERDTDENSNSDNEDNAQGKLTDSVTYKVLLDTSHYVKKYWRKS